MSNTPTSLASRLKQKYNQGITNLIPSTNDFQRRVAFRKDLQQGVSVEFDVQLSHESGFSVGTGDVSLNGASAQVAARAYVSGYSHILQVKVSYDLISRAKQDDAAFEKFSSGKFLNMVNSMRNREEVLALHGRSSVGKVESKSGGAVVITKASWSPAFWSGQVGAKFVCYDALDGTTAHAGNLTVTAVDVATRTVTFTSDGTVGDIAANDYIFIKGQHNAGRIGLMDIANNAGSLYGINAATYPLWSANSYDVGTSALTLGKILEAAGLAANKGCAGEKLVCYVPPKSFQSLVADESALIRHTAGKKKLESGAEGLSVLGATGEIEIVPHIFMKEGEMVMFPEDYTHILGSQEADMQLNGDDMVFDLESSSSKEMRMYSDNTVFCERPGYIVVGTRSDGLGLHE